MSTKASPASFGGSDDPARLGRRLAASLALAAALFGCRHVPQTEDPHPRTPTAEAAAGLAASVNPERAPRPAAGSPAAGPYRLGSRDLVEIVVLDHPEWRREMPVRPDGKISFLFVGDVEAAGRTVEELRSEIQNGLARFVRRPEVSVSVRDFVSQRPHVYVAGEVRTAGAFELAPPHDTFLDAIFAAGGVTPDADPALAYVVRGSDVIASDFDRLLKEGERAGNFVMADRDFLFIPKKDFRFVYVLGQVRNPSAVPAAQPIKLLEAVSLAGGLAPTAFKPDLKILRGGLRAKSSVSVDFEALAQGDLALNLIVYPGDIVFAPRSALTTWNEIVSEVFPTFSLYVLASVIRGPAR